jgi:hypothetical protein
MLPLANEMGVRAVLPTIRVPTPVLQHADDPFIVPATGKYVADHISGAKYVELPGRNLNHLVEPWRESFQQVYEFLTGTLVCCCGPTVSFNRDCSMGFVGGLTPIALERLRGVRDTRLVCYGRDGCLGLRRNGRMAYHGSGAWCETN